MKIYTADKIELLTDQLLEDISKPVGNQEKNSGVFPSLHSEVVVVQNRAMMQYLRIAMVNQWGVAAHLRFPFAFHLVEELKSLLDWPQVNPFSTTYSKWLLTYLVKQMADQLADKFSDLFSTSQSDNPLQLFSKPIDQDHFNFSFQLANTFDQYDFFRQDRLTEWERINEKLKKSPISDNWQGVLWNNLRECINQIAENDKDTIYPCTRREELLALSGAINQLNDIDIVNQLPQRLFIFAVSHLPQVFLEFLTSITTIPISFYQLNVTKNVADKPVSFDTVPVEDRELRRYFDDLAQPSTHFLDQLRNQCKTSAIDLSVNISSNLPPKTIPLLNLVQDSVYQRNSVLDLSKIIKEELPRNSSNNGNNVNSNSDSILNLQLHLCSSPQREVEVLKNNLLSTLERAEKGGQEIHLNDILVMAPKIETYLPYIQSIFSRTPKLKFSVSDLPVKSELTLWHDLQLLMSMISGSLKKSSFYSLLDSTLIQLSWGWTHQEVENIKSWLEQAGYIEEPEITPDEIGLTAPQNSLGRALEKLVHTYFLSTDDFDQTDNLNFNIPLPVGEEELFGRFLSFCHFFLAIRKDWSRPHSFSEWIRKFNGIILQCFFRKSSNTQTILKALELDWSIFDELTTEYREINEQLIQIEESHNLVSSAPQLAELVRQNNFDFPTFKWIIDQLFEERSEQGYLLGGITFSSLIPMRSLPFKVIALIGMDSQFPRRDSYQSFHLMNEHQPGDRSKKNDDKLLFLETLLSCRKTLLISYQNRSEKDQSELPISILISNLVFVLSLKLAIQPQELMKFISLTHPQRESDGIEAPSRFGYCNYNSDEDPLNRHEDVSTTNTINPPPNHSYWIEDLDSFNEEVGDLGFDTAARNLINSYFADEQGDQKIGHNKHLFKKPPTYSDLKHMLVDPVSYFVRNVLNIDLKIEGAEEDRKTFLYPSHLEKYNLLQEAKEFSEAIGIDQLVRRDIINTGSYGRKMFSKLEADFNDFFFARENLLNFIKHSEINLPKVDRETLFPLTRNFKTIPIQQECENWGFDFDFSVFNFPVSSKYISPQHQAYIQIADMHNGYRVYQRSNKFKNHDYWRLWFDHLFLCAIPNFRGTVFYKNDITHFLPPLSSRVVLEEFNKIGLLIDLGKLTPLPFVDEKKQFDEIWKIIGDPEETRSHKESKEPIKLEVVTKTSWNSDFSGLNQYIFPYNPAEKYPHYLVGYYHQLFSTLKSLLKHPTRKQH